MGIRVFIDTDVFISSLLSKKGAAFELLTKQARFDKLISNYSRKEIIRTAKKLKIEKNDAHILAGSIKSNSDFLVTYNMKDYKVNLIKKDFNIICLQPGSLLQIIRNKTS